MGTQIFGNAGAAVLFDKLETITRIENMLRVRLLNEEVKNQNIIFEF